jgi:hypothetical protein
MAGFEEGVSAKERDVMAAMSGVAAAGANAITTEAVSATPRGSGNVTNPVFNINYDFSGASVGNLTELRSLMISRDTELKEFILEVIEDDQEHRLARAYI